MEFEEYVKNVMRTATSKIEHIPTNLGAEIDALKTVAMTGTQVDKFKRAIFYGDSKSIEFIKDIDEEDCMKIINKIKVGNLIHKVYGGEQVLKHVVQGLVTESAECVETFLKADSEKDFDHVNFQEELGDLLWYITYYCNYAGITHSDLMEMNVAKLKKRYEKGFSKEAAVTRDLEGEREILEGK